MNSSLCVTNTHRKDAHEWQALFSEYPLSEVLFAVTRPPRFLSSFSFLKNKPSPTFVSTADVDVGYR